MSSDRSYRKGSEMAEPTQRVSEAPDRDVNARKPTLPPQPAPEPKSSVVSVPRMRKPTNDNETTIVDSAKKKGSTISAKRGGPVRTEPPGPSKLSTPDVPSLQSDMKDEHEIIYKADLLLHVNAYR